MSTSEDDCNQTTGQSRGPLWHRIAAGVLAAAIAGALVGVVCTALPNTVRVFWIFAAAVGVACGWIGVEIGKRLPSTSRRLICGLAIVAATCSIAAYGYRSVTTFAKLEAIESDESRAARLFLQSTATEADDESILDPATRWMTWRARAFGPLTPPWPRVIAFSEAAVVILAAAIGSLLILRSSIHEIVVEAESARPRESMHQSPNSA